MRDTKNIHTEDFDEISISIASPERIREWSYGEVTKPETINYRTQRAEKSGLFDEKIFGPTRDFECFCGKYKGIRYKGIVCDRCGVEITRNIVRRERGAHIELASPVAHIWFLRGIPSRVATLMGISATDVEKVVYFASYVLVHVDEKERARVLADIDTEFKTKSKSASTEDERKRLKDKLQDVKNEVAGLVVGQIIDEATYHQYSVKYGTVFEASIGAEAIYSLFKNMDLAKMEEEITVLRDKAGAGEKLKLNKRLALVQQLRRSKQHPEWMFLTVLPVSPPSLRPMVALEGGRHASSDANDLYRRVINRNNRLKKLMDIHAPEVILRNEKRILQEAVDALIDNSIRHGSQGGAMSLAQRRPLKSLSDYLKGKQGYFRQNLLGKRVDYSGRSVIVVGPELDLDMCGLPKHMALELFRPFIIAKLLERELAYNIRGAGRLIEDATPEVWSILEDVIKNKHVLLNRAPTLHRLGIQAFRPILIEGNAIRIHPLVCPAFNADFDGDQMAVHVPLSDEAQLEAATFMSAKHNILKPGNGEPVVAMTQDIVLGCYWMTKEMPGSLGEGKWFASPNEAISAYDYGVTGFRSRIKVLGTDSPKYAEFEGKVFETTVGRLLFNSVLPKDYPYINTDMKKGGLVKLINELIDHYSLEQIPAIVDKIKNFGFFYATRSGVTWSIDDLQTPPEKEGIITTAKKEVNDIRTQFADGLLSRTERKRLIIEVWHKAKSDIEAAIPATINTEGSVHDLVISGARGSMGQLTQMAGMKGLIQNTARETIEFPIIASYKEGLTPIEYFTTTHGSRSGLADTALNTARAGYLTRKLFDVAQDAIIRAEDCGSTSSVKLGRVNAFGIQTELAKNIRGRYLAEDVVTKDGTVLVKKGTFLTKVDALQVEASDVAEVAVRSPLTCILGTGICQKCYGADVTTWEPVDLGEAVGTVAAQAIGEPGTQLTMNTKHAGGAAAAGGDVVQGLPRVEEVFERRIPKSPAILAPISGIISEIKNLGNEKIVTVLPDEGAVKKGKVVELSIYHPRVCLVKEGQKVMKGDFLSDGSADLTELNKLAGREKTQEYIITQTSKIYELQGVSISRKHMEVIIRQMFSRRKIRSTGGTGFAVGDVVEEWQLEEANKQMNVEGGEPAVGETHLLGIMEVSLTRKSWLSASSFQNTTRVLINNAVRGTTDPLRGLKENVIIGRLIPAGTGYKGSRKYEAIRTLQNKIHAAQLAAQPEDDENATGVVITK
ncbi:MAG: DNA-directed RNA polymerase subunit beta' [Candidatus Pacebacteria bacterium]|nr:DNA-directed RNA polymerase subunit beta' [Candidatus Paceibacterota bacterium]